MVPGAWHAPDTFDGILRKRDHDSEAIELPSVGAVDATKSGLHAVIAHTNGVLRVLVEHCCGVALVWWHGRCRLC